MVDNPLLGSVFLAGGFSVSPKLFRVILITPMCGVQNL